MEQRAASLLTKLGIARLDTRKLIEKLVQSPEPFQALTSREIGHKIPTQSGKDRDREPCRKEIAQPLVELGLMEEVTRQPDGSLILGHPVANSKHCAYRLSAAFWQALVSGNLDATLRRRIAQESARSDAAKSTHETLMDACETHLASIHWANAYQLVYRDPSHGPRVDLQNMLRLSAAGLSLDPCNDPCPDLVFWNEATDALCVVEAVMTEGAITERRQRVLHAWLTRHSQKKVLYVTAFATWKIASKFMPTLSPQSSVWIQESPLQLWSCRNCPM